MGKKRILVINITVATPPDILHQLERSGTYEVIIATQDSPISAQVAKHQPALIVIAYPLPDYERERIISVINQLTHRSPLLILAEEQSDLPVLLPNHIAEYLPPPFTTDQLTQTVQRLLDSSAQAVKDTLIDMFLEATEAIIAVDQHNQVLFCNNTGRHLFQISETAIISRLPLQDCTDHRDLLELFETTRASAHNLRSEIEVNDGALTFSAYITKIEGVGRLAVLQDITHVRRLDQVKSEFVKRVSRDIRSPLTTILGYIELMERVGPINDQQRSFVDRIVFSVQSITALLTDLLELGRVETDYETELEPTQLAMIVRYAVEGARSQFEGNKQVLTLELPDRLPLINGNPSRLRQMITNLLDNAIKYTPEAGHIRISLVKQGEFLVLQVSDSGVGIPAKDQPHVFDRFYRGGNVMDGTQSTGLGLALVKSIVDKHNGRVWVESQEGKGTTFTVMLPAQNDAINTP